MPSSKHTEHTATSSTYIFTLYINIAWETKQKIIAVEPKS